MRPAIVVAVDPRANCLDDVFDGGEAMLPDALALERLVIPFIV
jgi:hypothetical protein